MKNQTRTINLRQGYTTGACAAAAAKGAITALLHQKPVMQAEIDLPGDGRANFII